MKNDVPPPGVHPRRITCDADVAEGAAWLCTQDVRWQKVVDQCAPLPLRLKPDGFGELVSAIVSQQVSTASAAAIWARVSGAGLINEDAVMTAGEDGLRAVGLSRPKIRYVMALAQARLDYVALRDVSATDAVRTLVKQPGIGPWTAEIYAMFSLGHADVLAAGDLALQEAARVLFELPDRPSDKELRVLAENWSPWRSVAARALWAYYRVIKSREGIR